MFMWAPENPDPEPRGPSLVAVGPTAGRAPEYGSRYQSVGREDA